MTTEKVPLFGRLFWRDLGHTLLQLGTLLLLAVPALLCYRAYEWLRYGVWPVINIQDALQGLGVSEPRANWIGIQKAIDNGMDMPVELAVLFIFGVMVSLGVILVKLFED